MSNDNRGLASADEETKKRVAREGGKASSGGGKTPNIWFWLGY
jgi:hypothetical protein